VNSPVPPASTSEEDGVAPVTPRAKKEFLGRIFLFQDLDPRSLTLVAGKLMEKSYAPDEEIFREGDMGRACFVVAEGRVELFRAQGTRREILTVAEPGDFFGEMVLLDELPRSASARAVEAVRLFIFYKTHFDALIAESPRAGAQVLRALARLLSARLRRQNATLLQTPRALTER
jgi:CRP-like cAMP-binding protein